MPLALSSLAELAPLLAAASHCYLSGCAAEIAGLGRMAQIAERDSPITFSGIFLPGINNQNLCALGEQVRCQTFFMTPPLAATPGQVDYCPWRYRDIIKFYQARAVDVALVMLSEPDAQGQCSYGVTSDYAPLVLPRARVKIGVVNRQMPFVYGDAIAFSELDYVLDIDQPLIATKTPTIDDTSRTIARHIASFIDDGATLQLGLGSIPGAVASAIGDRRGLKIRSGLIEANALALDDRGALCQDSPILGGVALGDSGYYRALHHNSRLRFHNVCHTHDIGAIAASENFVAVNGALEVDLFGQVNSCVLPKGYMSGPGGLPEFVAGALAAKRGRSIIALNASAKGGAISKIVPALSGGLPSVGLCDVDTVVTEFGIAELRGKSLDKRIQTMIAIADPAHREGLLQAASKQL